MLDIFVVYYNPKDYPGLFVVRRHHGLTPTVDVMTFGELRIARAYCASLGLVCLARHPSDDPAIVETWI